MAKKSPEPTATLGARRALVAALALTALVYVPALGNDFVNWDDNDYVYTNQQLLKGTLGSLASFWLDQDAAGAPRLPSVQGNYHPLTMTSLGADLALSGRDSPKRPERETDLAPGVFHVTNVLLHLANTALVFFFVTALLGTLPESRRLGNPLAAVPTAFVAALLFGITTMHVESVAWVSERKDVLYTFFFLLALLLYLRYQRDGRRLHYAGTLAAFLAALLSKGQAVTLAPTLVAVDWLLDRRVTRRTVLEKVPFFALALIFGVIATHLQAAYGNLLEGSFRPPVLLRPLVASYALVQYVVKLALPFGLLAFYPYSLALAHRAALYAVYLPAALAMLAAIAYGRRRAPLLAFGGAFFVLNVAPVLQFLPVGRAVMADRYTYVPSIGLFLCAGALGAAALSRWPRRAAVLQAAFAVYVVGIGVVSAGRAAVWRDSLTLWTEELAHNPESAVAYTNIAAYYFATGDLTHALERIDHAIALDPEWYRPWRNRGLMRDVAGQSALARADYDRSLALRPDQPLPLNTRGLIRQEAGDLSGAIDDFTQAIAHAPGSTKFYGNRAKAYVAAGRDADAAADLTYVLDREPDPELYSTRAMLRAKAGDLRGALADFSEVVQLVPDSPFPLLNRAKARIAAGDCAGARGDVQGASRLGEVPPAASQELQARCPT
jgi:tetratricopeptide (TPR) repeat protein